MNKAKALTITYLTKATYASLNGSDKEVDNISSIKKIRKYDGKEYPYCSSQAVRRALREQLSVMGHKLSEGVAGEKEKGAATTKCDPQKYIDDDLFGFMNASAETVKRTSPVRVSPLVALTPYLGELDFATNYMSVSSGGNPNIFETEIHSGYYCGTILVELDRIGEKSTGDKYELSLDNDEKAKRVLALVDAIQSLWTVGRQSRFLTDISPKLVCASLMSVKNPIFMESIRIGENDNVEAELIRNTISDFKNQIINSVIGERKGFFGKDTDEFITLGECFDIIRSWVRDTYSNK
ncbi:type I-B CRISPR-associated protein Cas7/Cst2/DevR [Lutispora saccharofermentans]|uniref:Type I-B CRISPR-associated protein Cas7/Cst2/DevR n=1 Tax=Lutispora saccharofermentans TaxID=3024236 RepID=A0ABT1ND46_9FIRM|nr:type I-B CRISPR-associated protein Cas7/Cst2/DevR [Lutispora saccharofermentans]MCQ1529178.1 type I-B CRISPR-associated protein Cas7/Cst2/DevR [Lutispora saccharofermentans]